MPSVRLVHLKLVARITLAEQVAFQAAGQIGKGLWRGRRAPPLGSGAVRHTGCRVASRQARASSHFQVNRAVL